MSDEKSMDQVIQIDSQPALLAPGPCGPLNAQEKAKLLPKEGLSEAMPEVLLPRAGLSLGDAGTVSLALRAPLRDHLWQGPPVRECAPEGSPADPQCDSILNCFAKLPP